MHLFYLFIFFIFTMNLIFILCSNLNILVFLFKTSQNTCKVDKFISSQFYVILHFCKTKEQRKIISN